MSTNTTPSSCGKPTRTVRNDSVYSIGAPLSRQELDVSGLHEFVILAASIPATVDTHYAGHRCNTVLNTGSYRIGSGASFTVRGLPPDCPHPSATYVAIKIPIVSNSTRAACRELRILSHPPLRSHRNIVELLGIAWIPEPSLGSVSLLPVLVLELSREGTLEDVWTSQPDTDPDIDVTTSEIKIGLCLDVARGLKALHDCDIVHGDMKCQNILLFKDDAVPGGFVAKLADFGHSVTELDEREGLRGNTPPWNAPEDNGNLNFIGLKAADIYSLGFVLWRILAGGAHPFQVITGTGAMLDPTIREMMKREESTVESMLRLLGTRNDVFHWIVLEKAVRAVLFGSIHPNPMVRSLRNVVNCLDSLVVNM
jgi:serine/threonine protein kinase